MNALPPRPGIARGTSPESGDVMGGSLARTLRGLRTPSRRRLAGFVAEVETASRGLDGLGESAFSERIDTLREQLRLRGPDSRLLAPTFGLVREAARRELGTPHYDVQLQGGFVMACGAVAEMETGEGKTLTTTLPACAAALAGVPVHVISANDYLVTRDASAMQPLYARLGLRVDAVTEALRDPDLRRAAYASDIAYATTRVLAFDYLRDGIARTQRRGAVRPPLLRGLCLALLDEADAVLVDEAHTPLVLAAPADRRQEQDVHRQALELARGLRRGLDFQVDTATREVVLLERGRAELETLAKPMQGAWSGTRRRERWVVQALRALHVLRRDRDYLVADGVVRIVDSGTGRASRDRSWDQGLQQLVELKEGCTPSAGRETLARISVQRFYRRYLRIAGTTGTAREVTGELRRVYGLGTVRIPTRRPVRRVNRGTRVFAEPRCKWMAVVESARAIHATGRPLLIGTGSVAASEHLANLLRGCNLPHLSASVGTTGAALTVDDIMDGLDQLRQQNVEGPYFLVLHHVQYGDFVESLRGEGQSIVDPDSASMLRGSGSGFQGSWNGVNIFSVDSVGLSGSDYVGALYGLGCFAYADGVPDASIAALAGADAAVTSDGAIWVEIQREAVEGHAKVVGNYYVGVSENEDLRGVRVISAS
jgi:preprotein translocase subunit SecA